jgi:hypothetical protein
MATELKHTVKPSGGDFTSLDAAIDHLVASHANLVGSDNYATVEIDGTWSSADTAAVALAGITTDATRYLHIYTTAAARHDGKWNTGAYMLNVANNSAITKAAAGCDFVRIDGLQIGVSSTNANYQSPIWNEYANTDGATWWVSNCILRGAGASDRRNPGLYVVDAQYTFNVWNTIVYNVGTLDHAYNSGVICDAGTLNLYSCVVIGGKYGVVTNGGTINAKNVYAGGTLTEDFYRGSGTLAKTNCASEDQSADDTGTGETATNCVAAAVALSTDTFTNVTAGSEDFHLVVGSALIGAGVTTSGESAPLNFTTDIDGDTRS